MKLFPSKKEFAFKHYVFLLIILIATVYGCRKEISKTEKTNDLTVTDPKIADAKSWYNKAYPINDSKAHPLHTNGADDIDISQSVKPDWQHAARYERLGKEIIEIPVDASAKFGLALKTNNWHTDSAYTRSYYLLLNDGQSYEACILTIIADSGYVKSDPGKLSHNTYRKLDADFTGLVLYSTPKGEYLGGYAYKNGQLLPPATVTSQTRTQTVQSVDNGKIKPNYIVETCVDWYTQVTITYEDGHTVVLQDWTYDTTVCTYTNTGGSGGSGGGGSGGSTGGGGSGPSSPPPPRVSCPAGSHPGPPVTPPCIPLAVESVDNSNNVAVNYIPPPPPPGDGGTPPPPAQTCSVDPPRVPCPTPPSDAAVLNQIKDKPFALYDILCDLIQKWLSTAKFAPDQSIINKLNNVVVKTTTSLGTGAPGFTSADIAHVQKINDAFSSVVNMDYFPVTVKQLPIVNGQRLTPAQFLQYIRLNINSFINDNKTFIPYNYNGVDDRAKWNSTDPKGALVAIDLAGPDNATVITSYSATDKWTFTTIYDPAYAGEHPVSGNRNFGYTTNSDGSYTFYTRGVDRLTSWDGTAFEKIPEYFGANTGIPFTMADNLWKSFQTGITDFVSSHSGQANVVAPEISRPKWDLVKDVLEGKKPLSTLSKDCPN